LIETELASWKIQNMKERVKKREREVRKSEIFRTRHPQKPRSNKEHMYKHKTHVCSKSFDREKLIEYNVQ